MKKLWILLIVGVMMLSLTACGIVNMEGEEAEINYDSEKMEASMETMKTQGLLVELTVTSQESGSQTETGTITYAETANGFYFASEGDESYFDFSDSTKAVTYEKNSDGVWVRSEIIYENSGVTREQIESSCRLQASALFGYLGSYEQFNGQTLKKVSTTIAGRNCDEFNISIGAFGYGINYTFAVDTETGMCLKWSVGASAGVEGSASASFVCNKFFTPYTMKFPTDYIEEDNGNDDTNDNGGNNGGNTDNDNSGDNNDNNGNNGGNQGGNVPTVPSSYTLPTNLKVEYTYSSFNYVAIKIGDDYFQSFEMYGIIEYTYFKKNGNVWDCYYRDNYTTEWTKDSNTEADREDIESNVFDFIVNKSDVDFEKTGTDTILGKSVDVLFEDTSWGGYTITETVYRDATTGLVFKDVQVISDTEIIYEVTSYDTTVTSFGIDLPQ